jgi:methyl-accepting chemotaxis protein
MTIKKLLQISAIGTSGLLILILVVSLAALNSSKIQVEKLINTDQVRLLALTDMYAQGLQMGQATRNNLIKGNDAAAQANYRKARELFGSALESALRVSAGKEEEELKNVSRLAEEDHEMQKQIWDLVKDDKREEATAFLVDKETPKWREMKDIILSSITAQRQKAARSLEVSRLQAFRSNTIMITIIILAICCTVLLGIFTYRRIGRRLTALKDDFDIMAQGNLHVSIKDDYNDEISAVAKSANSMASFLSETIDIILSNAGALSVIGTELKSGSEKATEGAREQSLRATQIAAAAEEMSQTISDIAKNTSSAKETTDYAVDAAQKGKITAEETVQGVKGIARATDELSDMISEMNSKTAEIGNIVTVINEIADQTNLLALNAAIEAARAGDAGRGFAVVADEVKKLAERTISATAQISSMIESVRNESVKTSDSMASATGKVKKALDSIEILGSSLESVAENIQNAQGQIIQIATAVDQQSVTAEEIATNVSETSKIAGDMRLMSGEVMVGARSLTVLAEELKEGIGRFDNGDNLLVFDVAKIRHKMFVEKVNGCVEGLTELHSSDLPDHHNCSFGKWYYTDGKKLCGHIPRFRNLEDPHEKLHRLAKDAVDTFNKGDTGKAHTIYKELESLSNKLIESIGLTKKEYIEEISKKP